MTGSCPVSAHICRETARERDELAQWKNRAIPVLDALALWKAEALPVLDGLQKLGKALGLLTGSQITGQEALAEVERLIRERDEARAEVERLRAGIEALADDPTWHRGMYGCPRDMVSTDRLLALLGGPTLHRLEDVAEEFGVDLTEGDRDE